MIQINKQPGMKMLELGGGAARHPQSDCNVDVRQCFDVNGKCVTDFTADFNEPLPINSDEWDCVYSCFALEHVSYRNVRQLLKEIYRITKPGGKVIAIVPNTESQLKWVQDNPNGWDGKDDFDSMSCIIFGDMDYPENSHRSYWSPTIAQKLFQGAGFEGILVAPFGERSTDMSIVATKPIPNQETITIVTPQTREEIKLPMSIEDKVKQLFKTTEGRAEIFSRKYFNGTNFGGGYAPFFLDYPCHELTARQVLARKPESVLELGAGRGYVLKRIEDAGIYGVGFDISKHCYLTRVSVNVVEQDLCEKEWKISQEWKSCQVDLCFSVAFFEHVPEEFLPIVFENLQIYSKRGLHGITFSVPDGSDDKTRVTLRPKEWWIERMPKGHEVVHKDELENGGYTEQYVKGDGKLKLNVGSAYCMFHQGWTNIDSNDVSGFAGPNGYIFQKIDVRNGLPFGTEKVDSIFSSHFLEHVTFDEGAAILREFRRVLKPGGGLRLLVPNIDAGPLDANWGYYDELSEEVQKAKTNAEKRYQLLYANHQAGWDDETLLGVLKEVGFEAKVSAFRQAAFEPIKSILKETVEMEYGGISLFVDAISRVF